MKSALAGLLFVFGTCTSCGDKYLLPEEWGFGDSIGRAFIPSFMKSEKGDTLVVNDSIQMIDKGDLYLIEMD